MSIWHDLPLFYNGIRDPSEKLHEEQLIKENQGLITNYHYLADSLLRPSNLSRPIANASVWSTVSSLNAPSAKWYLHLRLMPTA